MTYRAYLALEGGCSIVLGVALALLAAPGLLVDYDGAWAAPLVVVAVLGAIAVHAAARRGVPLAAPGRWLTEHPLTTAQPGLPPLPSAPVRRRLLVETAVWIVAVGAWVLLARQSGFLIFSTGLASAAFGLVQAFPARARVRAADRALGHEHTVARRPGLGTPELTHRDGLNQAAGD